MSGIYLQHLTDNKAALQYSWRVRPLFAEIFILLILIALNAFFAASEIALISLNDNKIRIMAEEGNKKAKILSTLLGEPSKFLATIQIGITLAGFMASAFASESFSEPLARFVMSLGVTLPESALKTISLILVTVILSYFTLVFGELVPKRLAMKKAEAISIRVASPLHILSVAAAPFVRFLTASTNFFVRLFGVDPNAQDEEVTEEEIRMMVDVGEEKGAIHETEKEMINNIFEFNNTNVTDIMTHRTDIAGIPLDCSLEAVMSVIREEKYTRLPVYEDNIDNIVGILHVKDLINFLGCTEKEEFSIGSIMRKPHFVPSSRKTDMLFKDLKDSKTHMAVVIDEYGGTAGIVTMEDLVEEIVGNIFDEYDEEDEKDKEVDKIDDNTFIMKGAVSLDTVGEILGSVLPVDEYETLSGFIIGQLGRIPRMDEKPEIEFNGLVFKVKEMEDKKISRVKVCRAS